MDHATNDRDARNELLFSDDELQQALSDVGVFATNYTTGQTFPSAIWRALDKRFRVAPEDNELLDYVHPDDRDRVAENLQEVFDGRMSRFIQTFRIRGTDDRWHWIRSIGQTVSHTAAGKPELYVGADFDITEMKQIEEQLRDANQIERERRIEIETLRSIVATIGGTLDLAETVERILAETRRIIPYDTATVQILHESHLEIIGGYGFPDIDAILALRFPFPEPGSLSTRAIQEQKPFLTNDVCNDFPAFVQPDQNRPVLAWLGIPLIRRGDVIGLMALDSCAGGMYDDHHIELAAAIGDHIAIALENARLHEQTYQMAMEDALTRAGSRHRFSIEGRLLFENAKRAERPISAVLIDIDHFKRVNDTYGHDVGDKVLRWIAQACTKELRATDLFARYGGEEFIVVLPDTPQKDAAAATERILKTIEEEPFGETREFHITVSAGLITGVPGTQETLDQFVRRADEALYRSKRDGRNRMTIWQG